MRYNDKNFIVASWAYFQHAADANPVQIWAKNGSNWNEIHIVSVCVVVLGLDFYLHGEKRTRVDEMGRPIGVLIKLYMHLLFELKNADCYIFPVDSCWTLGNVLVFVLNEPFNPYLYLPVGWVWKGTKKLRFNKSRTSRGGQPEKYTSCCWGPTWWRV